MNTNDLAHKYHVSRQAVCRKIKEGRIKAVKEENRWVIKQEDYEEYLQGKYVRRSYIFDKELENYSPRQCAEFLNCSIQRIYHHIRTGHIKASRHGAAWVINIKDLLEYKKLLIPSTERTKGYERKYKCFPYRSLSPAN